MGTNYSGCPTCPDDILLLTSSDEDMQVMLNTVNSYSKGHQYTINQTKSVLLKQNQTSYNNGKGTFSAWELGKMEITISDQATHLGITRFSKNENMLNVDERIREKKAIVKARILTGTYILQANKAKFKIDYVDSICPICRIEEENLIHFITRCPALEGIRRNHYGSIKQQIFLKIGSSQWSSKFRDRDIIYMPVKNRLQETYWRISAS
ncbi:unnamed protein product [Mytilus coruscus]|uniref:Reverse transcriptase domain-containing protein n=1 Tax=Mytilus coruscus TaxID=42192 RepID=A0A6J8CYL2_MYTCO|nr:unnamed protein product [Mytilus coruscus]